VVYLQWKKRLCALQQY